jgi:hypothetical protein
MNCLLSLGRWDCGFESHSRHGCLVCVWVYSVFILFCVLIEALRRADRSSKESCRLWKMITGLNKRPGPWMGWKSHRKKSYFLAGWDWSPLGTAATTGLLYQPQMIDDGDCGTVGGIKTGRGNRNTRRESTPAPLYPPQIPQDQTRSRTWAAAVGNQRLTAWVVRRPGNYESAFSAVTCIKSRHFYLYYCQKFFNLTALNY